MNRGSGKLLVARLLVAKDTDDWVALCQQWCKENLADLDDRRLYIPAGQTPIPLYEAWERSHPSYLKNLRFLQVDEVLTAPQTGRFKKFFSEFLPSYSRYLIPVDEEQPPAPAAILGLGLNGHVAFHEPGLPATFQKGVVTLEKSTAAELGFQTEAQGLSYGVGTFQQCRRILLLVRGAKKGPILEQLLEGNASLPATHLLQNPGLTLLADQDAYGTKD